MEAIFRINNADAFFVTRAKENMRYTVMEENFNIDQSVGLRSDKIIEFTMAKSKKLWGHSENAVKAHLWITICSHLIVAYVKYLTKSPLSIYELMQILNTSLYDKTSLVKLLNVNERNQIAENQEVKKLLLFQLSTLII